MSVVITLSMPRNHFEQLLEMVGRSLNDHLARLHEMVAFAWFPRWIVGTRKKEQQKIDKILSLAKSERELLKQQTALYRKQKRGLMQKLLTGEWRVNTLGKNHQEAGKC